MDDYLPDFEQDVLDGLQILRMRAVEDPDSIREVGYPDFLVNMLIPMGSVEEEDTEVDLEKESQKLYRELQDAKENFGIDDHSERIAYFRVSTQLMEKLVALRERAHNIKQISQFYRAVMGIFEEMLEPGQITEVRDRLSEYLR